MLHNIAGGDLSMYKSALEKAGLPDYMAEGVYNYVEHGMKGGTFLNALFTNNLKGTLCYADKNNLSCVYEWVMFLTWCIPGNCWGSEEVVKEWIAGKKINKGGDIM